MVRLQRKILHETYTAVPIQARDGPGSFVVWLTARRCGQLYFNSEQAHTTPPTPPLIDQVVSSKNAPAALSQLREMVTRPAELRAVMEEGRKAGRIDWNAESFLMLVLQRAGLMSHVRRFPRSMFLARGRQDDTRWSHGIHNKELNLYVKYWPEYEAAKRTLFHLAHYGAAGPGESC